MKARRLATLMLAAVALTIAAGAQARPRILRSFLTRYPHATATKLQNCVTCHAPDGRDLNPYGLALQKAAVDFEAVEKLDSDRDGYLNAIEIRKLAFPGDPKDHPGIAAPVDTTADSTRTMRPDSTSARPDSSGSRPGGAPSDTSGRGSAAPEKGSAPKK